MGSEQNLRGKASATLMRILAEQIPLLSSGMTKI